MTRGPFQSNWKIIVDDSEVQLSGTSLFLGSDPLCDVNLRASGVASFHCEFTLASGHWIFNCEDLGTTIQVNGEPLTSGEIRSGDVIHIGSGEITFFENPIVLKEIPGFASFEGYEDLDSTKAQHSIAETGNTKRIEVINYHNGHIQDVVYLPLRHGAYSIGSHGEDEFHIPFNTLDNSPLFTIEHRSLHFHPHPELTPSESWEKLGLGETIFLTKGAEQVSLRIVQQSVHWKRGPFSFDMDFWKSTALVGLFLFLPFLALQLIDLPQVTPPKPEVVVIYKLKETDSAVEKNAPSETPSETIAEAAAASDSAPNPELNPAESAPKVEVAEKASNPAPSRSEPVPVKAETVAIAEAKPTPPPKAKPVLKPIPQKAPAPVEVAAAPEPEKTQEPVKESVKEFTDTVAVAKEEKVEEAPKKTYSFNSGLTKSLVGPATEMKLKVAKNKIAGTSEAFSTATKSEKSFVGKMNKGPGKLSEESSGTSLSSSSRGIASKSGFDTSSIDKNTVIRGSMDPEVLRKILREYIPQFRHCYQQELIYKSEKIKGILDLDFTINAQGKASRYTVKAKDTQFSQRGIDCMGNVLAIIDFPKPKGGGIVDVSQPLNFFAEK